MISDFPYIYTRIYSGPSCHSHALGHTARFSASQQADPPGTNPLNSAMHGPHEAGFDASRSDIVHNARRGSSPGSAREGRNLCMWRGKALHMPPGQA